jgi:hypothetical protein
LAASLETILLGLKKTTAIIPKRTTKKSRAIDLSKRFIKKLIEINIL